MTTMISRVNEHAFNDRQKRLQNELTSCIGLLIAKYWSYHQTNLSDYHFILYDH